MLLAILYFVSQGVRVAPEDITANRVTTTTDAAGAAFDWDAVTGKVLSVSSTVARPDNAAVAVQYRDQWFYIDDADQTTKSTFALLGFLFALTAGATDTPAPVLTLPIGN